MSIKIHVRCFQSLRDISLELSGFTVITGPSNVGKSAIVRAFQAAVFGALGDFFITDKPQPEDQCAVSIVDEKTTIKWWKVRTGKGSPELSNALVVNGVRYTKFGKEQAELTRGLGFVELDVAGQKIRPQIALQFDPIFLLSGSETEAAEALRLLGRVDVVTEAQRLATKDAREQAQKLKIRGDDCVAARMRAEKLKWLPGLRADFIEVQTQLGAVLAEQSRRESGLKKVAEVLSIAVREVPAAVGEVRAPQTFGLLTKIREAAKLRARDVPASVNEIQVPSKKFELLTRMNQLAIEGNEYYVTMLRRQNIEAEIVGVMEIKKEMEKELGKCPTCDRTFN